MREVIIDPTCHSLFNAFLRLSAPTAAAVAARLVGKALSEVSGRLESLVSSLLFSIVARVVAAVCAGVDCKLVFAAAAGCSGGGVTGTTAAVGPLDRGLADATIEPVWAGSFSVPEMDSVLDTVREGVDVVGVGVVGVGVVGVGVVADDDVFSSIDDCFDGISNSGGCV